MVDYAKERTRIEQIMEEFYIWMTKMSEEFNMDIDDFQELISELLK